MNGPVFALLSSCYSVLRRWNRSDVRTPSAQAGPGLRLRRKLQSNLLRYLERSTDIRETRAVLAHHRTRLNSAALQASGGPRAQLESLRRLRPLQSASFLDSPEHASLPAWARDAIVLMDLQRVLEQWGLRNYLTSGSDFYGRDIDRAINISERTENKPVADQLNLAKGLRTGDAETIYSQISAELRDLLEAPDTWDSILPQE